MEEYCDTTSGGKPIHPFGLWEIGVKELRRFFADGAVEDVLFVITYEGRTPEWPS